MSKRIKLFEVAKINDKQLWLEKCRTCKHYKRNATYRYYCAKELNPIDCNSHERKSDAS